jgi:L-lactate utilization protein LutC
MSEEDKSKETTEQQDEVKEIPPQDAGEKVPEKISLTQKELDGKLADARRKAEAKLREVEEEYKSFKQTVEQREQAANDAAAEQVEALRKDLPEAITKLLDKLTPIEQLEWLRDPENAITKKQIPELPTSAEGHGKQRKQINIV